MLKASDMKGRAALVTGASGALGRAAAIRLGEAGADVCLVDEDAAAVEGCAEALCELGVRAHVHVADVSVAEQSRAAVAAAAEAFGRLDALCNVANVFFPASAEEMPQGDWERTLAVNLSAPFYLIQASLPHLLAANGAVVNVTSCAAFMASPFTAAYTASKAGLTQMTKALAKEYMDRPVRINCVAPGSMAIGSGSESKVAANVDMTKVQKLGRRLISVEEVAEVIAFLASDASSAFHGACISIDNGISLG